MLILLAVAELAACRRSNCGSMLELHTQIISQDGQRQTDRTSNKDLPTLIAKSTAYILKTATAIVTLFFCAGKKPVSKNFP